MKEKPKTVSSGPSEATAPRFELHQQDNGLWNVYDRGMLVVSNVTHEEAESRCEAVSNESKLDEALAKSEPFARYVKAIANAPRDPEGRDQEFGPNWREITAPRDPKYDLLSDDPEEMTKFHRKLQESEGTAPREATYKVRLRNGLELTDAMKLEQQRDELLAALKEAEIYVCTLNKEIYSEKQVEVATRVRTAIAKAEGNKQ